MKKVIKLIILMVFTHFFLLEALFVNLEINDPHNSTQSGWAILLVIDVFIVILSTISLVIIGIYENYTHISAKIATYLIVYVFFIGNPYMKDKYLQDQNVLILFQRS